MTVLSQSQFPVAFNFVRSEVALVRNAAGAPVNATLDVPRFDHSTDGEPRGLLVAPGFDLGGQDRVSIDELMLSAGLIEGANLSSREATIYHAFRPAPVGNADLSQADWTSGIVRRAFYTREAKRVIDQLLRGHGHHLSIGVHEGFAQNRSGFARYGGQLWQLPNRINTGSGVLGADGESALITSGARLAD